MATRPGVSTGVELFLDDTPGEVRGIVARDGRFQQIFIDREGEPEAARLGARSVGRVVEVDSRGRARIELGSAAPMAVLAPAPGGRPREGEAIEVEVSAEAREDKGPVVRRLGPATGAPRLLAPGPTAEARLRAVAPDVEVLTGIPAIQAAWDAEEEALADGDLFAAFGLDLAVQRTRALIAVDLDFTAPAGRDDRGARTRANREGLKQAARLIRLKRWGGLVAVDLIGTALDGAAATTMAREAFAWEPQAAFGPVSKFGLLQLSLPWRFRPIEEALGRDDPARAATTAAIDLTRRLRHALLSNTAAPRLTAIAPPALAAAAGVLVARLGPRAGLRAEAGQAAGHARIEEV